MLGLCTTTEYKRSLANKLGEFCLWLAGWCAIVSGLITLGLLLGTCAGQMAFAADDRPMHDFEQDRPSTADTQCLSTEDLQSFLAVAELEGAGTGYIIAVRTVANGTVLWVYVKDLNLWCVAGGEEV